LLPQLLKAPSEHPLAAAARETFKDFSGEMRADSPAPLIFSAWVDEFTRGVVGQRLGRERVEAMYGKRNFRNAAEALLESDNRDWCGVQGCAHAAGEALGRALDKLSAQYGTDPAAWRWGDAHPAVSVHRPLSNVKPLARLFEVRVPSGGDPFTVNVGQYQ